MSDEDVNASENDAVLSDEQKALIERTEWSGRQVDWLLQWFVKLVGSLNIEIGITLTVGGSIISGNLVSHQSYFDKLAEDVSAPFAKIASEETAETMKNMILAYKPGEPGADDPASQYLHLKDCQLFTNGVQPTGSGALWRGKISAVDGFTLGRPVQS
ncbi:gas vesicle accessory protein GvpU [Pseudomonas rhodesiae]|uniref:gas vesicle accessory protein GvpU n=1 Tax=Pseudomonas rhodesiae TaxID=76760 RepID=UPI0027362D7A|nr:gas vesicle accessory protein GvpU [Pseudomonas rhodesiae]WLG37634.1 gas vesicle protein [Pseudomonas rhodesiae]